MAEFVGLASLGVLTTVSQAREELRPERRVDKGGVKARKEGGCPCPGPALNRRDQGGA